MYSLYLGYTPLYYRHLYDLYNVYVICNTYVYVHCTYISMSVVSIYYIYKCIVDRSVYIYSG